MGYLQCSFTSVNLISQFFLHITSNTFLFTMQLSSQSFYFSTFLITVLISEIFIKSYQLHAWLIPRFLLRLSHAHFTIILTLIEAATLIIVVGFGHFDSEPDFGIQNYFAVLTFLCFRYLMIIIMSYKLIVIQSFYFIVDNIKMQGTKRVKLTKPQKSDERQIPQKIWINFINNNNQAIGRSQIPLDAGPEQFQAILNQLLPEEDQQQYNFFYKTKEVKAKLLTFFKQIGFQDFQDTLDIIYHPVSQFKVKPVTRASSSMFGHTQAVLFIQFSPNSKHLASGSGDGTLRLWDINTQTPLKQVKCDDWVMIVQWSTDGQKIAYAQKNGNITVYTLQTEQKVTMVGHSKFITSLCWQPLHLNENVDTIISSSKDFTIRMWNALTGVCLRSFGNHTKCVTKVLWTGGNQIISGSEDQKISVYDSNGNFVRGMRSHSHWVNTMSLSTQHVLKRGCFDPEKKLIVGEHGSKKQIATKMYNESIKIHKQRFVSGSDDFTIQLFELPQKKPIKQMTGHVQPVVHVQFSPDGRYIISGSFDKSIKLWDGYNGEFMYTFRGHVGPVYQIAWSTDSRYLVSASKDSTLKLWDIKTRKLMKDLPGHADEIYALDWSSDGDKVATGGKDRQVKIWVN